MLYRSSADYKDASDCYTASLSLWPVLVSPAGVAMTIAGPGVSRACPRRDHAERREEADHVRRLSTLHSFCRPVTRTSDGAGRQGHTRDLVRRLRQSGEDTQRRRVSPLRAEKAAAVIHVLRERGREHRPRPRRTGVGQRSRVITRSGRQQPRDDSERPAGARSSSSTGGSIRTESWLTPTTPSARSSLGARDRPGRLHGRAEGQHGDDA